MKKALYGSTKEGKREEGGGVGGGGTTLAKLGVSAIYRATPWKRVSPGI